MDPKCWNCNIRSAVFHFFFWKYNHSQSSSERILLSRVVSRPASKSLARPAPCAYRSSRSPFFFFTCWATWRGRATATASFSSTSPYIHYISFQVDEQPLDRMWVSLFLFSSLIYLCACVYIDRVPSSPTLYFFFSSYYYPLLSFLFFYFFLSIRAARSPSKRYDALLLLFAPAAGWYTAPKRLGGSQRVLDFFSFLPSTFCRVCFDFSQEVGQVRVQMTRGNENHWRANTRSIHVCAESVRINNCAVASLNRMSRMKRRRFLQRQLEHAVCVYMRWRMIHLSVGPFI